MYSRTALARRSPSAMLYSSVPRGSHAPVNRSPPSSPCPRKHSTASWIVASAVLSSSAESKAKYTVCSSQRTSSTSYRLGLWRRRFGPRGDLWLGLLCLLFAASHRRRTQGRTDGNREDRLPDGSSCSFATSSRLLPGLRSAAEWTAQEHEPCQGPPPTDWAHAVAAEARATHMGRRECRFALPQTRPMQWLHRGGAGSWTSHHSRAILEPWPWNRPVGS